MKQYNILTLLAILISLFCVACADYEDPALYTPSVSTGMVESGSITRTEATLIGIIKAPDIKKIRQSGFRYSFYESMAEPTTVESAIDGESIRVPLSGLETGRIYYYYAFASGGVNEVRGEVQSFTTRQYDAPVLGKVGVADIGESSLHVTSSLIDNGGDDLNTAGFVYRAYPMSEPDPIPSHTNEEWQVVLYKDYASIKEGATFTDLIENLVPDTEYALSAFASNKANLTGYSEVVRFRTQEHTDVPKLGLAQLDEVTETSMVLSSSVVSDGGYTVIERGFCYSTTNAAPTLEDIHEKAAGDDKGFQIKINN